MPNHPDPDLALAEHEANIYLTALTHHANNTIPKNEYATVLFVISRDAKPDTVVVAFAQNFGTRSDFVRFLRHFLGRPANVAVAIDQIPQVPIEEARDAGELVTLPRTLLRRLAADACYMEGVSTAFMGGIVSDPDATPETRQILEDALARTAFRAQRMKDVMARIRDSTGIDLMAEDLDD